MMISELSALWLNVSVKPSMKLYLTGIDWIINSIDYASKSQSGIGNISQVILALKDVPDSRLLHQELNTFTQKFTLLNGFPSRDLNLCPYWKVPLDKNILPLRVDIVSLNADEGYLLPLTAQLNKPFKNKKEHLVFTLVNTNKVSFLGMTFDHRILDARGAEIFLNLFQQYCQKKDYISQVPLAKPSYLNHWAEKFKAGKQVNRFFLNFSKETPRVFPPKPLSQKCRFEVVNFNPEQTERFINAAYANAGYLMLMPYALAKSVQIMHRIFQARDIPGLTYLIPVPLDARLSEDMYRKIFFNHLSFLLFNIKTNDLANLSSLLKNIKEQMYKQVQAGLPEAIKNASLLLRIATLPLVNLFLRFISKKHFASFSFSFVNSHACQTKFMENEIENIFHLPRVPNPPGVGLFFNQFNNKLNITLSYCEGLLTENEAGQIVSDLKTLGNEN